MQGELEQLVLYQVYHNFCCSTRVYASVLVPEATRGKGSAKLWRPWTPAMAVGWTDHVW